jgi:Zn-dependent protease
MFLHRVRLFTLAGVSVWVDASWIVFAILIVWTLAVGVFPSVAPGLPVATYWWMGIAGAIVFFFSIIFHELSHSLVARRFNIPITGITLFIFGGVAELHQEPTNAKSEFWMAAAGPASSMVLGTVLLILAGSGLFPRPIDSVLSYLGSINWALAIFNLAPAFPLDGGRILRSVLWWWKRDFRRATLIASQFGAAFGILLIVYGGLEMFRGAVVTGIWLFLIGLFLNGAAGAARQQMIVTQVFSGRKVCSLMNAQPVSVSPDLSLRTLVEDYFYRYHFRMFPVVRSGTLLGCITAAKLRSIPQAEWGNTTVGEAADRCSANNTITADNDALEALAKMRRAGSSQLLVIADGQLRGILTLTDMLQFLSINIALGSPQS